MSQRTAFLSEDQARLAICQLGREMYARALVHGTAGNISLRLEDAYLVTPRDACMGRLDPARLALLDLQGRQLAGDPVSKTLALHQCIYETSANTGAPAGCVIHTHSLSLLTCSLLADPRQTELLPALTPYFVMKVGRVPHIPYHRPGALETVSAVAQAIASYAQAERPIRAVMLARLGPLVWHDSLSNAMATLQELEETSKLWALCLRQRPEPLGQEHIDELRRVFAASW